MIKKTAYTANQPNGHGRYKKGGGPWYKRDGEGALPQVTTRGNMPEKGGKMGLGRSRKSEGTREG